jgi:hypothetical protein
METKTTLKLNRDIQELNLLWNDMLRLYAEVAKPFTEDDLQLFIERLCKYLWSTQSFFNAFNRKRNEYQVSEELKDNPMVKIASVIHSMNHIINERNNGN